MLQPLPPRNDTAAPAPSTCEGQLSFTDHDPQLWEMIRSGDWAVLQPDPEQPEH